jgi:LPXTG-motif cell wall-anchored protein
MKTMTPRLIALMVGLAFASSLPAQDLNTGRLAPTETRMLSCGQVDMAWNVELITQYPRIPEACFEVVTNNNIKWARFEADFVRLDRDGSVVADFYGPSGAKMGRYTVLNNPGDQVTLGGRKYPFSALRSGQRINLYVPEGAAALTTEPGLPPDRYGRFVRYEELPLERRVADPAPTTNYYAAQLPNTAGPLPWFAVAGLGALLGGLGLRLRKRG